MSGETWLLSAMALSAPANAGTTSYTPEVREAVVVEMQRDCAAAENTFTGFAAVQENIKNASSSREETASALKEQSTEAHKTISEIAPKTEIEFFNQENLGRGIGGVYELKDNLIYMSINGGIKSNFDEKDVEFRTLQALAHERHHEINAHRTIETSDGKTVLAQEAPMSLAQQYMLEQANEISANIAEYILLQEAYCEASKNLDATKKNLLSTLQNDEQLKNEFAPVMEKIENVTDLSIQDNKICYNNGKNSIEIKDPQLLEQFNALLQHQQDKDKCVKASYSTNLGAIHFSDSQDKPDLDKGTHNTQEVTYNPLSQNPEDIKKAMQYIGETCAKNWMNNFSAAYQTQCNISATQYFRYHNFQDVKANDENFNKALSAMLTVGGWDFSEAVKSQLACQNSQLIEADKMISNGANELDVLKAIPDLAKNESKKSSRQQEVRIATEYVKGKSVGQDFPSQPVVWSAEYKQEFAKNLTNIQNQINTCPKEQQEQANKLLESLNLSNQKEGTMLSAEQIDNLGTLSTILDNRAHQNPLYIMNRQIQIASVSDEVKQEWQTIAKNIGEKNFNLDDQNIYDIKRQVVGAYSGQEFGMSAEEFKGKQTRARSQDELSTITMTDLSQPFLLDRYNKYAEIAAAKERVGNKLDKTQAAENTPPAQTTTKTSVNMAQLAAQRQGGR